MRITQEFDYRNGIAAIEADAPGTLDHVRAILTDANNKLDLAAKGKQRDLSAQVQRWFVRADWQKEQASPAIPDMKYDLLRGRIPIEIELGHQRLVFPDFFKFLADYSKGYIPGAVMVVTGNPHKFGHDWHCSIASTAKKIEAAREVFLVPVLVIAVDP